MLFLASFFHGVKWKWQ